MAKAAWIIRNEHHRYAAVLHCLRSLVREIERGRVKPDFALFRSILDYIDTFLEKYHHPKEDAYLFEALRRCHGRAAEILDGLESEHQRGGEELADLRKSLDVYARDGAAGFARFKAAALAFSEFQSRHAMKEEVQILPLAEEHLSDEDWAAIDAAFTDHDDPLFGDKAKAEFGKLFSKIVEMAPAPYGLGPTSGS